MQFPTLRIQSQPALIGISNQPGIQHIEQPKADMQIQQSQAEMNFRTRPGKLSIDQSKAWADMGKYGALEASKREAQKGKQAVMEAIAEKSREGEQLKKIENGGDVIASLAKQTSMAEVKPATLDWIPSHFSVKTSYTPAEAETDIQARKPVIQATPQQVVHQYTPGQVDVYLRQQADLQIEFQA